MGIFRPVFVYALHISQDNPNQNRWLSDERAVQHDLSSLLASARTGDANRDDPYLEYAWYAVEQWLHEILAQLPNGDIIAADLLPEFDLKGTEFYHRLGVLLTPGDDGVISSDAIGAIKIFNMCLDLDYRGYYARPGCEHQRQAYRRRCRQIIEAELSPSDLPPEPEVRGFWARRFGRVALWVIPLAATIILYGMYRAFLKDLYHSVVG